MRLFRNIFGSGKVWDFIRKYPWLADKFTYKLKLRGLFTRYSDPSNLVLWGAFTALNDFIEDPWFQHIGWQSDDYHQNIYNKSMGLYNWWNYTRPARYEPSHEGRMPYIGGLGSDNLSEKEKHVWEVYCDLSTKFEEFYYEEDQQKLRELVEIRRGLWT